MQLQDLKAPFAIDEIEVRVGSTNADKTQGMALAYLTSRAVMDRLDEVVSPENWQDNFAPGPVGGVICGISIKIGNEWITKWDGADNTDIEGTKGGLSDSFKRAAVKWGIGRYLYSAPSPWVAVKAYGKSVKIVDEEAAKKLIVGKIAPPKKQAQPATTPTPQPAPQPAPVAEKAKAPDWPASGPAADFCKAVQLATGNYYTSSYHLSNTIGGYGNLKDDDNWNSKLSAAVDHANQKRAEKLTPSLLDIPEKMAPSELSSSYYNES